MTREQLIDIVKTHLREDWNQDKLVESGEEGFTYNYQDVDHILWHCWEVDRMGSYALIELEIEGYKVELEYNDFNHCPCYVDILVDMRSQGSFEDFKQVITKWANQV